MKVLIVESNTSLSRVWGRHLERHGAVVIQAVSEKDAIAILRMQQVDIIVCNLMLEGNGAFAVADFASYRYPEARVVFVTASSFFSDGSIFQHIPNACAFLPLGTPPEDLTALVEHYGTH
jgi:CheY-like chemotaxis protein